MKVVCLPSREEIRTAYGQGEEAVVASIVELGVKWAGSVQQQQSTIQALQARIEALENQVAKNSSTQ